MNNYIKHFLTENPIKESRTCMIQCQIKNYTFYESKCYLRCFISENIIRKTSTGQQLYFTVLYIIIVTFARSSITSKSSIALAIICTNNILTIRICVTGMRNAFVNV